MKPRSKSWEEQENGGQSRNMMLFSIIKMHMSLFSKGNIEKVVCNLEVTVVFWNYDIEMSPYGYMGVLIECSQMSSFVYMSMC